MCHSKMQWISSWASGETRVILLPEWMSHQVHQFIPITCVVTADYQLIPGHGYYKVHNVLLTWDEGRRLCEMDGAHMVVFDSQEEADAVFEIADCCPWVGVSRQNSRSPWMTVLGQPLSSTGFTGWATGYPLESGNCNMIFKNNGIGMINWICSLNLGVICEKPLN
ncbi:hemolymph lipopolysaccharide-binding protein isoform X2 [Anabrus simplex]|uniref:hemolymph lipopolysaccharide-binding protein isoform X2 n=1 Tax=Anabrus simplex TaxID=316456 RepID=UPI0035A37749